MAKSQSALKSASPGRFPIIRIDHLWVAGVLTLIGVFITLVPTPPNDFWWHLKAGQIIAEQGIPHSNLFAWTLPADTPYIYATWLGEWLFYILSLLGGLEATALARNLLGLAGFALVAMDARRRSGSWRLAALAALLAGLMTINNLIIRTQNWSWVPFGVFVYILSAYAAGTLHPRYLVILPLIMAFWVNAHGAFVLGLGLIGLTLAGETLRQVLGHAGALGWRRLTFLVLVLAGAMLATLLNPLGPGIFEYVLKLLTDPPSQGLINEWQPPTTRSIAGFWFFASVVVLIAALAFARRRPTLTDVLLICVFLWQAWNGQRYVVWFGMVAMPILAQSLAGPADAPQRKGNPLANTLIAGMLALTVLCFQPPIRNIWPFPKPYMNLFANLPGAPLTFNNSTPVAATEWLRAHQPGEGRLFNEMGYGSYLIWALYPEAKVFIDPRVELYPLAHWQDYAAISTGENIQPLLDTYQITRVMLDRGLQPKLSAALKSDTARWTLEYQDAQTEIYRRR